MLKRNKNHACQVMRESIVKEIFLEGDGTSKKSIKKKNKEVERAVKASTFEMQVTLKLKKEARKMVYKDRDGKRKEMLNDISENMRLFLNGGLKKAADTKLQSYQQSKKELLRNLKEKYPEVQKTRRKF
ncbi:hypothetical protein TNCT_307751 [Trichonephila clavata]|uniref:Uncharacterized protein n=1 Tax=Trichonephila clavata TaxID=2740835 RepID=A0A8X6G4E9_TRICU|nr:hypothetical protein TNCT_307751 [Trichonephila clavata]